MREPFNISKICLVFINYQKVFDKVCHIELFKMLTNINIDNKDMRVVRSVYYYLLIVLCLLDGTPN